MTESPVSIAASANNNSIVASSSPASSSTSEDEVEHVPLSVRLSDLSQCELGISALLASAALAVDALNPAVAVETEQSRRDKYAVHAEHFFDQLEKVAVKIKRSVRGLEEAEVPISTVNARWLPHEEQSYDKLVREFTQNQSSAATAAT